MSKLAQAVEQAVREMRAETKPKERRRRMTDDEIAEELAKDPAETITADPATTATEGATDMATTKKAKKKSEKKPKAPKAPKVKKAKVEKAKKVEAAGAIVGAKAKGETYLQIEFENGGHVTLTPTSNRVVNRDLVVKAINIFIKS